MKAVIPAAGLGSRFLPATKAVPKEMLPVVNRPIIQYIVEEALASGADEIVIINSVEKTALERHFEPEPDLVAYLRDKGKDKLAAAVEHAGLLPVSFVYQDRPLGLGHAVHCAASICGQDNILVMLGDVLVASNDVCTRMIEVSQEHDGASVIAVMPVPNEEVGRYGIAAGIDMDGDVFKIEQMIEKPDPGCAPSNFAIFGRYLLVPRVMDLLAETTSGAGGEIQLTDALVALLDEQDVYALVVDPAQGHDCGTLASWLSANIELAMQDPTLAVKLRSIIAGLCAHEDTR